MRSSFKKVIHYEKIDSTQKEAWRRIEKDDIEDGTVIIADLQTDGIGTHGRKWYTVEKENIAFSFVIYPNVSIEMIKNLTIEIAEILVEIFKRIYHIELSIKLPNDIMVGNKKLGGILTQTKLQGEIVKNLVIGIGMNTNGVVFDKEIQEIATSIKKEFDIIIDNELVIQEFGYQFEEKVVEQWKNEGVK